MSSEPPLTERDAELRRMLVATASAAPLRSRRRWSIGAPIAAFALAGALTGAVSATALSATGGGPGATVLSPVTVAEMTTFIRDDTRLFGGPVILDAATGDSASLGAKPAEAVELALAFRCGGSGEFEVLLDGEVVAPFTCDASSSPRAGGAVFLAVPDAAPHTLTVSAPADSRYVLWASWATRAVPPEPSPEQASATADGDVTEAEYRAQFARYSECMTAAGYPLGSINTGGEVITYTNSGVAVDSGAEARCYAREFEQVDIAWQSTRSGSAPTDSE